MFVQAFSQEGRDLCGGIVMTGWWVYTANLAPVEIVSFLPLRYCMLTSYTYQINALLITSGTTQGSFWFSSTSSVVRSNPLLLTNPAFGCSSLSLWCSRLPRLSQLGQPQKGSPLVALQGRLCFGEELKLECIVGRKWAEFWGQHFGRCGYLQPAQENMSSCLYRIFHFPVSQQLNEEGRITSISKVTYLLHRNYGAF